MEVNTDKAFVEAVLVIKSLTDLSKKSNLPRPTIDDRLNLYGLYSQATKGDINSNEPDGNRISEVRKYNAWKAFKGLTRKEARRQYCKYLLDVLKNNYSQETYPIVSPLRDRLQEMWDMLENHNLSLSIGESVHLGSPILPDSLTQTLTATTTSATTLPPPQPTNGVSFNTPSYNIPPRAQSPAVSLFRMASSGINPSMIRPPSRNHSVSISRKNSVGATNYNNSNSNPLAKASTNIPTDSHHADLTTGNSIQHFNNVVDTDNCAVNSYNVEKHINSLDFLKWQGEINNTLLKISTELANLKYRQISTDTSSKTKLNLENVEQRNFTGSTTLSCGGFISDYKRRNANPNGRENNSNYVSRLAKFVYSKLSALFQRLQNRCILRLQNMNIANASRHILASIIALSILSAFEKLVGRLLRKRYGTFKVGFFDRCRRVFSTYAGAFSTGRLSP